MGLRLMNLDQRHSLLKAMTSCEEDFTWPVTFQRGELVAVVKGANPTLLQKTILQQLEVEKKVLAEGREWNVVSGGCLSN